MRAKATRPASRIARYEISDRELPVGSTLGAPKGTLLIKATGAIEKLYSCEAGSDVFGTLVLHHWDPRSGIALTALPGQFVIHPYHQEHVFELSNGVSVHEDIFMLSSEPKGADLHVVDPPAAYYMVEMKNEGDRPLEIGTYASLRLRGGFSEGTIGTYDSRHRAFFVRSEKLPDLFRVAACSVPPASYEITLDSAKASAAEFPGKLSNTTSGPADDPIGIFHLTHLLKPGERASFYLVLTFSLEGEDAARDALRALPAAQQALDLTREYYDAVLTRAQVITPDDEVNRGVLWAKANMLRVQSLTSQGWCFVNDPTRSNNSVARDTHWYASGADYVTPDFARESLLWYVDHLEPDGMVVEYFDIRNGKTEDYGLNINDDTPLIILSIWHHYNITGDRDFLMHAYPKAQRAARYILSQRNDKGLVWCSGDGTADWGIVGWRNVIKGYRLSGATTEVNSECYAALKMMSSMALEVGDPSNAAHFAGQAADLRKAINEYLLDKNRNLYYLNIDLDGTPRTDVTCDLVFPVMFEVADHDVAANIIARLSTPEFWSDAGLHTVPRNDIMYGPTHGYGLRGGVWAGPTFWFAFAAAAFNPEFMAYALSVSFAHYSQDPRRNNTVPGQFSEWLHGETLTNQGMALSPWFAPKYLWAAIEGAGGLDPRVNPPALTPRPSRDWSWMGVRNLRLRGKDVSWFAARIDGLRVYATHAFASVQADRQYEIDISDDAQVSGEDAIRIAMQRENSMVILVGNTKDRTITTSLTVHDGRLDGSWLLRAYNTLRGEWIEQRGFDARRLHEGMPIQLNQHGFCVIEMVREA